MKSVRNCLIPDILRTNDFYGFSESVEKHIRKVMLDVHEYRLYILIDHIYEGLDGSNVVMWRGK